MLRCPTRAARSASRESPSTRPRAWALSKTNTKETVANDKIGTENADLGIYTVKILGKKLPVLGFEIGSIPVHDPAKVRGAKKDTAAKDVVKVTDVAAVQPPRKIETFIDQFSTAPNYKHSVSGHLPAITGGLAFNPNDHPLLCDLDEERDAVMYGRGKEFLENIKRVRVLLLDYHKWELSEKWYRGATLVVQLWVAILLYFIWYMTTLCELLMSSFDTYEAHIEEEIRSMGAKRDESKRLAIALALGALASGDKQALNEAQRQARRLLLPDSADLTAIVLERMKAYHEEKHANAVHPR